MWKNINRKGLILIFLVLYFLFFVVVDQRGNKPYKRCSRSKENTTQTEVCFCDKSNLCNTSQAMEFDKYFLLLMASVVALTQ